MPHCITDCVELDRCFSRIVAWPAWLTFPMPSPSAHGRTLDIPWSAWRAVGAWHCHHQVALQCVVLDLGVKLRHQDGPEERLTKRCFCRPTFSFHPPAAGTRLSWSPSHWHLCQWIAHRCQQGNQEQVLMTVCLSMCHRPPGTELSNGSVHTF